MKTIMKDWEFILEGGLYSAPEQLTQRLCGKVYNHPSNHFLDGELIQTSAIRLIDLKHGLVSTRNTTYYLEGPPNQKWLEWLQSDKEDWERWKDLINAFSNE